MIDVLHRCLPLWERGERKAIGELLAQTGYGRTIYRCRRPQHRSASG